MKTNFSTSTVSGNVSFSFAQMAVLTDMFGLAALEAATAGDTEKAEEIFDMAETLGFEIDPELGSTEDAEVPFTSAPAGQDSDQTG